MTARYKMEGSHLDGSFGLQHRAIAERALGKKLPLKAEVHHADGERFNNASVNLVICPSRAYHMLLHARTRALDACGNANFARCARCKEYSDPSQMSIHRHAKNGRSTTFVHQRCKEAYEKARIR